MATLALLCQLQQAAKVTGQKAQRINISLSSDVLEAIRALALQEDFPYQTLISSALQKYDNSKLHKRTTIS